MRKVLMTLGLTVVVLCVAVTTQVGLFVVPAGATTDVQTVSSGTSPAWTEGVVYLVTREADMRFVDSADAICERQFAASDSDCRGIVRGWIMRESRVLAELPYSEALWRMANAEP